MGKKNIISLRIIKFIRFQAVELQGLNLNSTDIKIRLQIIKEGNK